MLLWATRSVIWFRPVWPDYGVLVGDSPKNLDIHLLGLIATYSVHPPRLRGYVLVVGNMSLAICRKKLDMLDLWCRIDTAR